MIVRALYRNWTMGILTALAALLPLPSQAQFVLYHALYDDWTVTCARNEVSGQIGCELDAPPETLSSQPPPRISVASPAGREPAVWFRLPGAVSDTHAVQFTVDSAPPVETSASRYGEGGWEGAGAQAVMDAMMRGKKLTIRWWAATGPEGAPQSDEIDLSGFADALADYRGKVTQYGAAALR